MSAFTVTVRTERGTIQYPAIAQTSIDAHSAAIDVFGVAAITVIPLTEGE